MIICSRSCYKFSFSTCLYECSLIKILLENLKKPGEQVLKFFRTLGGEFTKKFLIKNFMKTGRNFLILSIESDSNIGKMFFIHNSSLHRRTIMKLTTNIISMTSERDKRLQMCNVFVPPNPLYKRPQQDSH